MIKVHFTLLIWSSVLLYSHHVFRLFSEKKAKKGEFQPFVSSSDHDDSDKEGLVVDENPSKKTAAADSKKGKTKQPKLKLKLSCKCYMHFIFFKIAMFWLNQEINSLMSTFKIEKVFPSIFLLNLSAYQFGSHMRPHMMWCLMWIQIVCKGLKWSKNSAISG